jgi:Ca-activated chloride channel family protein
LSKHQNTESYSVISHSVIGYQLSVIDKHSLFLSPRPLIPLSPTPSFSHRLHLGIYLLAVAVCVTAFILVPLTAWGYAWSNPLANKTREGNKAYSQGKYDAALKEYLDAQIDYPESEVLHFNIGDVLFKQKKYKEASEEYQKALQSKDRPTQAKAYYNLGNCKFRENDFPGAIEQYKKALVLNPNDQESKFNLELTRRKLKEMAQNSQQNQQNSQQSQGDQKKQENSGQQSQQQNQQKNPGQQSQQQNQQDKQQLQQDPNQKMALGKKDEKKQDHDGKKMSKEDALRILKSLSDRENMTHDQKYLNQQPEQEKEYVEHDW